jgi:hypothetical protein
MRKLIIFIIIFVILLVSIQSFAQKFSVTYQMRTIVKTEATNGKAEFNIPIDITYTCVGNKDSSKTILANADVADGNKEDFISVNANVNMPDYFVFTGGKSYTVKNKKRKLVSFDSSIIEATKKIKRIEGYMCIQYLLSDPKNNLKSTAWVCKALPSTIMPAAGMKPLDGAILEFYDASTKMEFKTLSIQKLK